MVLSLDEVSIILIGLMHLRNEHSFKNVDSLIDEFMNEYRTLLIERGIL